MIKDKTYFEIFDLPISIEIDIKQLTQAYYKMTMQYHPDRYTLKTPEEQAQAIDNTAIINEAYRVLKNKQSRLKYILINSDVTFEEGQESVPQEFLMDMMDINEGIMEYKMEPDEEGKNNLIKQLTAIESGLNEEFSPFITKFKSNNNDNELLLALKDYYLRNQYIKNIKNNLNG